MNCDLAVNDREELIYLLTEAAEFEHTVMCTYLHAQWSLKRGDIWYLDELFVTIQGERFYLWRAVDQEAHATPFVI